MLHKLIDIAGDKGLKKLMFEVVAGTEEAAKHTAQLLGFIPVASLPDHVRDAVAAFRASARSSPFLMQVRMSGAPSDSARSR